MSLLRPDRYFNSVTDIRPEELHALGIRGLILDVDNTLTTHGNPEISPEIQAWLYRMKAQRFQLAVVSNNARSRVEPFGRRIGVAYFWRARKPFACGYKRAQKLFGLRPEQIAVVGDQVFTDIAGAKGCGMHAFIVRPLEPESGPFFRFKRRLERPILREFQ